MFSHHCPFKINYYSYNFDALKAGVSFLIITLLIFSLILHQYNNKVIRKTNNSTWCKLNLVVI